MGALPDMPSGRTSFSSRAGAAIVSDAIVELPGMSRNRSTSSLRLHSHVPLQNQLAQTNESYDKWFAQTYQVSNGPFVKPLRATGPLGPDLRATATPPAALFFTTIGPSPSPPYADH